MLVTPLIQFTVAILLLSSAKLFAQAPDVVRWTISDDGSIAALALSTGEVQLKRFPEAKLEKPISLADSGDIGAITIDANGSLLAIASRSKPRVDLFRMATADRVKRLEPTDLATAIRLAPDGKSIAIAGQFALAVYDVESGKKLAELPNVHQCQTLVWSNNSKLVGLVCENRIKVWFPSSKKLLMDQQWTTGVGGVIQIAFAPDGRKIATRFGQYTNVWDVVSGKSLQQCNDGGLSIPGLGWSADGKCFITCTETDFILRDATVSEERTIEKFPIDVKPGLVQFSRGAKRAIWMGYNLRSPDAVHFHEFDAPCFEPPVSAAMVAKPNPSSPSESKPSGPASSSNNDWNPPKFAESEKKLANNPKVVRYDAKLKPPAGKPAKSKDTSSPNAQAKGLSMALSGDGKTVVVGGMDGEVFIGEAPAGKIRSRFRASENSRIEKIVSSSDGKMIAFSQGNPYLDVWSDRGQPLARLDLEGVPEHFRFSPRGSFLIVSAGETLYLYRSSDLALVQRVTWIGDSITAIAISRDETLVAIGAINQVYLWKPSEDKLVWRVESEALGVSGIAISPENKTLVVEFQSPVSELYDIETSRRIRLELIELESAAYLDEDRIIGGDSTRSLQIASAKDLSLIKTLPHPSGGVNIEAYSNQLIFNDHGTAALFTGGKPFSLTDLKFWPK